MAIRLFQIDLRSVFNSAAAIPVAVSGCTNWSKFPPLKLLRYCAPPRYLFVKHSEGWNVDRCTRWMQLQGITVDWCYPESGQPFPDPAIYRGVVIFGGATSANDCSQCDWVRDELLFVEQCLKTNVRFFGICLGAQMLARVLGATVQAHPAEEVEIGFCKVLPTAQGADFLTIESLGFSSIPK